MGTAILRLIVLSILVLFKFLIILLLLLLLFLLFVPLPPLLLPLPLFFTFELFMSLFLIDGVDEWRDHFVLVDLFLDFVEGDGFLLESRPTALLLLLSPLKFILVILILFRHHSQRFQNELLVFGGFAFLVYFVRQLNFFFIRLAAILDRFLNNFGLFLNLMLQRGQRARFIDINLA